MKIKVLMNDGTEKWIPIESLFSVLEPGETPDGLPTPTPGTPTEYPHAWVDIYTPSFAKRNIKAKWRITDKAKADSKGLVTCLIDSGSRGENGAIIFGHDPKVSAREKFPIGHVFWGYKHAIPAGNHPSFPHTSDGGPTVELLNPVGNVLPADWVELISILVDGQLVAQ